MGQVKVATRTSTFVWRKDDFSPTVQRNCMKLGRLVAPDSGCLNPILWHSRSFRFGAENVLVFRFTPLIKCTVDRTLQTLITPHSKVLCN